MYTLKTFLPEDECAMFRSSAVSEGRPKSIRRMAAVREGASELVTVRPPFDPQEFARQSERVTLPPPPKAPSEAPELVSGTMEVLLAGRAEHHPLAGRRPRRPRVVRAAAALPQAPRARRRHGDRREHLRAVRRLPDRRGRSLRRAGPRRHRQHPVSASARDAVLDRERTLVVGRLAVDHDPVGARFERPLDETSGAPRRRRLRTRARRRPWRPRRPRRSCAAQSPRRSPAP